MATCSELADQLTLLNAEITVLLAQKTVDEAAVTVASANYSAAQQSLYGTLGLLSQKQGEASMVQSQMSSQGC